MGTLNKKIYIVHGWAYSLEKWDPFLSELKSNGFDPVILNVPGLTAPIDKPYTIDDYVSWLDGNLKNENEPVTILAHSNGGRISLFYTQKYPEKIKNLILIGSAGIYHRGFLISLKRTCFKILSFIGKPLKKIKFLRDFLYKLAREKDYKEANETMQITMSNLINVDALPFLKDVTCPTLLIWGENDGSTPLSDGKIFAKNMPKSELHIIKNARHSPQFTHVGEVMDIIKSYYVKTNI